MRYLVVDVLLMLDVPPWRKMCPLGSRYAHFVVKRALIGCQGKLGTLIYA